MKKLIQIAVLLPLAILVTGCASPYMLDRGRDAADIFTGTIGKGAGVKARLGIIGTGLFVNRDIAGLRGGTRFRIKHATKWDPHVTQFKPYARDYTSIIPDLSSMVPFFVDDQFFLEADTELRHKDYSAVGILPLISWVEYPSGSAATVWPYNTQMEAAIGLGGTLRLGFNPGELLDFILGWGTIDIYNDDLEKRAEVEQPATPGQMMRATRAYQEVAGRKLGTHLAEQWPDSRVLIIVEPKEASIRWDSPSLAKGLRQGFGGRMDSVLQASPAVPPAVQEAYAMGLGPELHSWYTGDVLDTLLKEYKDSIELVVVAMERPEDFFDMQFWKATSRPKIAIACGPAHGLKKPIADGRAVCAVVSSNRLVFDASFHQMPPPDLETAFKKRFVFITPENVQQINQAFPGLFEEKK